VVREPLLRLPWPLPALLVWGASWSVFLAGQRWLQLPQVMALLPAAAVAIACSLRQGTRWRKIFIAWGFPLSLAASGLIGQVPAWTWLLPLAMLAVVYPVRTWTDAPLFPTPAGALRGLAQLVPLPPGARIVDAGCGLGDGLRELQREYPQAHLAGIEWGWPLFVASCLRARFAQVRRGDLWRDDWWPMSWSTCSSGRRAWGARPRRQGASSAAGLEGDQDDGVRGRSDLVAVPGAVSGRVKAGPGSHPDEPLTGSRSTSRARRAACGSPATSVPGRRAALPSSPRTRNAPGAGCS
jgi:hypothetical protein